MKRMYAREITGTSKSALLELGLALHAYRDDIVLSGGWAPFFITENHFEHCGSVDIDLILRTAILPHYESIRKIVTRLGYTEENRFRFKRKMQSPVDGKFYSIHVDFLCDKCDLGYHFRVQPDLEAFMFEGAGIAFECNFRKEIETILPGNGIDRTSLRVLDLAGSIVLKGQALAGRKNPKDAYDIFALTHYNGGPEPAARYFNESLEHAGISSENRILAQNSLDIIRRKFRDGASAGSFDVETFSEMRYRRSVVSSQVNAFLSEITLL